MKRFIVAFGVVAAGILLTSVSFRDEVTTPLPKKHAPSCGYTVIEYGLGVDCNGDTIKISRKNTAQVMSFDEKIPA